MLVGSLHKHHLYLFVVHLLSTDQDNMQTKHLLHVTEPVSAQYHVHCILMTRLVCGPYTHATTHNTQACFVMVLIVWVRFA